MAHKSNSNCWCCTFILLLQSQFQTNFNVWTMELVRTIPSVSIYVVKTNQNRKGIRNIHPRIGILFSYRYTNGNNSILFFDGPTYVLWLAAMIFPIGYVYNLFGTSSHPVNNGWYAWIIPFVKIVVFHPKKGYTQSWNSFAFASAASSAAATSSISAASRFDG